LEIKITNSIPATGSDEIYVITTILHQTNQEVKVEKLRISEKTGVNKTI
jgi:hypothetical protein